MFLTRDFGKSRILPSKLKAMREPLYKIINVTEFWSAIVGAIVGGLIALEPPEERPQ
jgi:hypothetical protein